MAEAARIFVSHAQEDTTWCCAFVDALRQGGARVWYDEHNLGYGVLGDEIEQELRACPCFIVILSPASVAKPGVRREMNAAIGLHDENPERVILPVVAEETEIPLMWRTYKRVSGLENTRIDAAEAATRVISMLGIVPGGLSAAALLPENVQTAAELALQGDGLYAQRRYLKALAVYEQALALNPQVADVWASKGNVLYDLQRYEEALSAYDGALALDPKNAGIWNNQGNVLAALHENEEALSAYDQALALDSQAADVWNNKGAALQELKRPEEALAAYDQALTLDPQYAAAWYNKGSALQDLGRPEEALSAINEAQSLDPTDAAVWNTMIDLLKQLGRGAEAREAEYERDLALRQS
jgi:tetratricopeptide (TPR) repeat protein